MKMSEALLAEFDQEMATTRRTLERVPEDKFGWQPHEKSMTMGRLACHIAGIPNFGISVAKADSMDLSKEHGDVAAADRQQLLAGFDRLVGRARSAIAGMSDEDMARPWSLLRGETTLFRAPKAAILRTVMMNHLIHHRGQLSVYLRLTNTPVPSIYGPSADEGIM